MPRYRHGDKTVKISGNIKSFFFYCINNWRKKQVFLKNSKFRRIMNGLPERWVKGRQKSRQMLELSMTGKLVII